MNVQNLAEMWQAHPEEKTKFVACMVAYCAICIVILVGARLKSKEATPR